MTERVLGYLLMGLSVLLYLAGGTAFVAMLRALTVSTTLAAIESAFGSLVICILLAVLARWTWDSGKKRTRINA
jgi:hypothetical protein